MQLTALRAAADAEQNACIVNTKALQRVMTAVLNDDTQLFKQFMDNEGFRRWLTDTMFGLTYERPDEAA
jgi:type I restriction enzyme R subunit